MNWTEAEVAIVQLAMREFMSRESHCMEGGDKLANPMFAICARIYERLESERVRLEELEKAKAQEARDAAVAQSAVHDTADKAAGSILA